MACEYIWHVLNGGTAVEINYKVNVMGGMCWTNEWINNDDQHHEYLFLMEKS